MNDDYLSKVERYTTESYHNVKLFLLGFFSLLGMVALLILLVVKLRLNALFGIPAFGMPVLLFVLFQKNIVRRFTNRVVFEFDPERISFTELRSDGTVYAEATFFWGEIRAFKYSSNQNNTNFAVVTQGGTRRWTMREKKRGEDAWAGDSLLYYFTQYARRYNAGRPDEDRIVLAPTFMATGWAEALIYIMGLAVLLAFTYGASHKPERAVLKMITCVVSFGQLFFLHRSTRRLYRSMKAKFEDNGKQTEVSPYIQTPIK